MIFCTRKTVLNLSKHRFSTKSIVISDHVKSAIANREPVVALESTIITHGMPRPHNLQSAKKVQMIIENEGAIPATIAVLKGQVHVGLSDSLLQELSEDQHAIKISRRDFPFALANKLSGGTTVAGTMMIAHQVDIPIFVTGGIGGVHRAGETTLDISADLTELGRTPVAVICAGVKSILDIGRTLEYLETQGVPVATLGPSNSKFPAFFCAESDFKSPLNIPNAEEAAAMINANHFDLKQTNGLLLAVPIPAEHSVDNHLMEEIISQALDECAVQGVIGKDITPFILDKVNQMTAGQSLQANQALIENNALHGARIAVHLSSLIIKNRRPQQKSDTNRTSSKRRPVVVGGSNFDIICQVNEALETNASTVNAKVRTCFGGVGRNLADALARLDCNPIFISAVGDDHLGQCILSQNSKLDKSHVLIRKDKSTATYCLTLDALGDLKHGIGDMDIHQTLKPADILKLKDVIAQEASMVVLDANFADQTVECILQLCHSCQIPVFFEPTDPRKACKAVKSAYASAIQFASPNIHELRTMAQEVLSELKLNQQIVKPTTEENEDNLEALLKECTSLGRILMQKMPFATLVITLGKHGALLIEPPTTTTKEAEEAGNTCHFKCVAEQDQNSIVSASGAGDCLAAAFISGLLQGLGRQEALRLGLKAARLSLNAIEAVPETLSTLKNQNHE